jgi:hypothetical protein
MRRRVISCSCPQRFGSAVTPQALELVLASLDCNTICMLAVTCSQLHKSDKSVLHGLV